MVLTWEPPSKERDVCPERSAGIWEMIKEDEDIVLEATVGGKTTAEMRMSCSQRNNKTGRMRLPGR